MGEGKRGSLVLGSASVSLSDVLFILILILLYLASPSALAQVTDETRMDAPGGSMEHVPVQMQGGLGDCYSYAASEIVDAYRFSHAKPDGDTNYDHLTSPEEAGASWAYHQLFKKKFDEGGFVCPVIGQIRQYGSCDANSLKKVFDEWGQKPAVDEFRKTHSIFQTYWKGTNPPTWDALKRGFQDRLDVMKANLLNLSAGKAVLPSDDELLVALKIESDAGSIYQFLKFICEKVPRQPVDQAISCHTFDIWFNSSVEKVLREWFDDKNTQPITINFCSRVLLDGKNYNGRVQWTQMNANCGPHAALVIGRRKLNGTIQYLIRNSWGSFCFSYSSDWSCENGSIWVDSAALAKSVYGVSYITTEPSFGLENN